MIPARTAETRNPENAANIITESPQTAAERLRGALIRRSMYISANAAAET